MNAIRRLSTQNTVPAIPLSPFPPFSSRHCSFPGKHLFCITYITFLLWFFKASSLKGAKGNENDHYYNEAHKTSHRDAPPWAQTVPSILVVTRGMRATLTTKKEDVCLAAGHLKTPLCCLSTLIFGTGNSTRGWMVCVTHYFRVQFSVCFADYRAVFYYYTGMKWLRKLQHGKEMIRSGFPSSPAILTAHWDKKINE